MNGQINQAMKTPSQSGTAAGNVFGVNVSGWSVTYDAGTGQFRLFWIMLGKTSRRV